jgi:DNA uptake protein ComE-like DNA-binding protein
VQLDPREAKRIGALVIAASVMVAIQTASAYWPKDQEIPAVDLRDRSLTAAESWLLGRPMDLNSAEKEELELIPLIGPKVAARLVAARPFQSFDQVDRVKGIGRSLRTSLEKETIIRASTSPEARRDSSAR